MKVMVVAGEKTSPLVKQLKDTGAVEIVSYCNSLANAYNNLKSSLIKVDNLIYVYNENMNIRADMQVLNRLMSTVHGYFSVGHIDVFYKKDDMTSKGIEAFLFQMRELNFVDYSIKSSERDMTYIEIYNSLLGVDIESKVTNTYEQVYMVEKNSTTKTGYVEDYTIESIEPFDYKNIELYRKRVQDIERIDNSLNVIVDEKTNDLKFDSPDFGSIARGKNALAKNIYLCSGLNKTGVTSLCNTLAYGAKVVNRKVLILDLQNTMGVSKMLELNGMQFNSLNVKDLFGDSLSTVNKDILTVFSIAPSKYHWEVLSEILNNKQCLNFDDIFIDAPLDMISKIYSFYFAKINKIFLGCFEDELSIKKIKNIVKDIKEVEIFIMLCEVRSEYFGYKVLSPIEMRQTLGDNNIKFVSQLNLVKLEKHNSLYMKLCQRG